MECPYIRICLMFLSWLEWSYGFGGGKMPFLPYHVKGTCDQHDIAVEVNIDYLAQLQQYL